MKAIIIGASGLIGNELLQLLLESKIYQEIHLIGRQKIECQNPCVFQHIIDFSALKSFKLDQHVDHAFCCLGTTMKKAKTKDAFYQVDCQMVEDFSFWCLDHGVSFLAVISALGASKHSSIFYNSVKGEMEEKVLKVMGDKVTFLRPSLLLGQRKEFRLGELLAIKLAPIYSNLIPKKLENYLPIEASLVAKAMLRLAQASSLRKKVIESNEIRNIALK